MSIGGVGGGREGFKARGFYHKLISGGLRNGRDVFYFCEKTRQFMSLHILHITTRYDAMYNMTIIIYGEHYRHN